MYFHLGQDMVVRKRDLIGVFDMDTAGYSALTREFLHRAEKESRVTDSAADIPRSFALTDEDVSRVYLTPVSTQTLGKRFSAKGFEV